MNTTLGVDAAKRKVCVVLPHDDKHKSGKFKNNLPDFQQLVFIWTISAYC